MEAELNSDNRLLRDLTKSIGLKGVLQKQQLPAAQKPEILTRALAETGIVPLIDEATGHEKIRPQNALQA